MDLSSSADSRIAVQLRLIKTKYSVLWALGLGMMSSNDVTPGSASPQSPTFGSRRDRHAKYHDSIKSEEHRIGARPAQNITGKYR